MNETYLGKLDISDPLYEILFSQVSSVVKEPLFHVNRISAKCRVYKYTEEKTKIAIIGKFFKLSDKKEERILRIRGEYDNLHRIRGYGFDTFPHYVVRPFVKEDRIGLALTEEFIYGKDLDHYLRKAIYERREEALKDRLSRLAAFLYALHTKTETDKKVELDSVSFYFQKILNKLNKQTVISDYERKMYLKFMDKWLNANLFQNIKNVIIHGDATPTNFIFTNRGDVVAIDLERMKNCDPALDAGMVCGELKHAFMWRTENPYAAEPFISHFLKDYSSHFFDRKKAFKEITFRNPFYMAMTELRIARNDYLHWTYRKRLVHEAMQCLKWGLTLNEKSNTF